MGIKTGIEHIDTNIVLRLITRDDEIGYQKAKRLLANQEKVFVLEDTAVMEIVFVLMGRYYNYSRARTAKALGYVINMQNVSCNSTIIGSALEIFVAHPKLSFTDCYLAVLTETSGETPLWTLDKKLAKQCAVAKELI